MKYLGDKNGYGIWMIHAMSWVMGVCVIIVCVAVFLSFFPLQTAGGQESVRLIRQGQQSYKEYESAVTLNNVNSFVECSEFDIKYLIKNYYDALKEGDRDTLAKYVDDVTDFSDEMLLQNKEYVENYMDIQCYYMEGMMPGTYLVAAYSYVKYYGIYTTVPNIEKFYVCTNANGRYFISNKNNGDEISSYNELMFGNSQITEMQEMAEQERAKAIQYDSQVKELLEKIWK